MPQPWSDKAGELTLGVKALATKPNNLSLIPGMNRFGELTPSVCPLTTISAHINTGNKMYFFFL
jgi:hypothetical protein